MTVEPPEGQFVAEDLPPLGAEDLPPRSRGVIGLLEENCTVCMLCARECPDWCIYIESHKEPVPGEPAGPAPPRGRQRVRNALDRFAIDFSLCMYCGICIEVCPYDALFWSPEFSYAETGIAGLTHERDRLREWMWTVPPPPALHTGTPPPGEGVAAGSAEARLPEWRTRSAGSPREEARTGLSRHGLSRHGLSGS